MDIINLIENQLSILGSTVTIKENGNETQLRAVTEAAWRRNQSHFEPEMLEAGRCFDEYYHYIGPASFDITALENAEVIIGSQSYEFVKSEAVRAGDRVVYYSGVLKKIEEADGNVFSI